MSIWGKVLGGTAGLALGGPLGALIGAIAGHAADSLVDRASSKLDDRRATPLPPRASRTRRASRDNDATKQVAFTTAVIVLGAKMAKADGVVTRDEVDAFKEVFRIPPEDMKAVGRLFDQAKKDARGYETYARQMARLFHDNPAVLEQLLDALFHIAKADDQYHPKEQEFLRHVAEIFGFGPTDFRRIQAKHTSTPATDPYAVLGIEPSADDQAVKRAYRLLVKEHHPDALVAQGMPKEFIDQATEKLTAINRAYETIEKERGL